MGIERVCSGIWVANSVIVTSYENLGVFINLFVSCLICNGVIIMPAAIAIVRMK